MMVTSKQQVIVITILLAYLSVDVTGDTFYSCRAADTTTAPPFTISCPSNTVIDVQSALVGYSGSYQPASVINPNGSCPWTVNTSNTCAGIGSNCQQSPTCNCNCTLSIPANCNGQSASCSFQQSSLLFLNGVPLCVLSRDAEFLSVNYTCNSPTTTTTTAVTKTTTTATSTTTLKTSTRSVPSSTSSTTSHAMYSNSSSLTSSSFLVSSSVSPPKTNITDTKISPITTPPIFTGNDAHLSPDCKSEEDYQMVKRAAVSVGVIAVVSILLNISQLIFHMTTMKRNGSAGRKPENSVHSPSVRDKNSGNGDTYVQLNPTTRDQSSTYETLQNATSN